MIPSKVRLEKGCGQQWQGVAVNEERCYCYFRRCRYNCCHCCVWRRCRETFASLLVPLCRHWGTDASLLTPGCFSELLASFAMDYFASFLAPRRVAVQTLLYVLPLPRPAC